MLCVRGFFRSVSMRRIKRLRRFNYFQRTKKMKCVRCHMNRELDESYARGGLGSSIYNGIVYYINRDTTNPKININQMMSVCVVGIYHFIVFEKIVAVAGHQCKKFDSALYGRGATMGIVYERIV